MRFAARLADGLPTLDVSRPGDIVAGAPLGPGQGGPAIPYVLDYAAGRTLHVLGADPMAAARATFHYQHLRAHLTGVEVEEFGSRPMPEPGTDPIFIFSPGRCGSTLLAKGLQAMGLTCFSEPDIYTATALHTVQHGMTKRGVNAYIAASRRLLAPFHAPVLVKLRSQCCAYPDVLLPACSNRPKVIFLTRNFVDWGVSASRSLGFTPQQNATRIKPAMRALGSLRQKADLLLLSYAEISQAPTYSRIAGFVGAAPVEAAALAAALARDSQQGTALERHASAPDADAGLRQAHAELWQQILPHLPFPPEDIAPFAP